MMNVRLQCIPVAVLLGALVSGPLSPCPATAQRTPSPNAGTATDAGTDTDAATDTVAATATDTVAATDAGTDADTNATLAPCDGG